MQPSVSSKASAATRAWFLTDPGWLVIVGKTRAIRNLKSLLVLAPEKS